MSGWGSILLRLLFHNLDCRRLHLHSVRYISEYIVFPLMEHSKRSLFVLFCIVFLDMLGVGIVIPILASLFLDVSGGIFSFSTSFGVRTFVLGLLIAVYSATQFIGAPLLGGLSDHYGRKKIFLLSIVGTVLGYTLFAFG